MFAVDNKKMLGVLLSVMDLEDQETPLKQYFKTNGIKVKDAHKVIGVSAETLYRILRGEVRPNTATAKSLFHLVNGQLTIQQIRPALNRPKCPCCKRMLKKHHLKMMKTEENQKMKQTAKENIMKKAKTAIQKNKKGLLSP